VPIYQLKITLSKIRPPIWRRVLVRGDTTLLKLHKIIQAVMPWEDNHLHQLIVGDECYSIHLPEDPLPRGVKNKSRENTPIAHKIRQILMFPGMLRTRVTPTSHRLRPQRRPNS